MEISLRKDILEADLLEEELEMKKLDKLTRIVDLAQKQGIDIGVTEDQGGHKYITLKISHPRTASDSKF